jgi:hypothetical protein
MNLRTASSLLLLSALTLGALLPRVALATPSLDACTGVLHREAGTTTTITVDAPGTWCLDQDLVESVDAVDTYFAMITVDADDVTIDCRGHRLEYTGFAASSMHGIASRAGRKRVTVRNCHLYGFSDAISVVEDGFLIEDNIVRAGRPRPYGSGTAIYGGGSGIIRRNRIYDAASRGIYASGSTQVLDNLVDGLFRARSTDQLHAIDVYPVDGAEVRGNTVRDIESGPEFSQDVALMIDSTYSGSSTRRTRVVDNVFVHDGSEGDYGVQCPLGSDNVLVSDNVLSGLNWPANSCGTVVDNDVSP